MGRQRQSPPPPRPPRGVLLGEEVHTTVQRLRAVGAIIALGTTALVATAAAALVWRAFHPTSGGTALLAAAAGVSILALGGGLTALELLGRRAKRADSLAGAVSAYKTGCIAASAANFLAGGLTVAAIFHIGIGGRLWMAELLLLALNVLGLATAMPKMKHLRALHYRPVLPTSRL